MQNETDRFQLTINYLYYDNFLVDLLKIRLFFFKKHPSY